MSGSNTGDASGVYGTKGMAAVSNIPGARDISSSWTGTNGNLWLFGGQGYDSTGSNGMLNDLWKYDPSSGEWTWMSGSNTTYATGVYGTLSTAAASNVPGARESAVTWTDASGNLWLFGGYGYDSTGSAGYLNDLWKYDPSSGQWTWMGGSNTTYASGVYGTQGTTAASNIPGARESAVTWVDASGNLWLFGGYGYDSNGSPSDLNDLWKYDPSSGQWTWMSGSNTVLASGVYGTQGTAGTSNVPGARESAVSWTDTNGNLWLFGGAGYDSTSLSGDLNDLWKYDPSSGQWTWVSGSNTKNAPGVYGTQGTSVVGNVPSARDSAVAWSDANGNLWLFGGNSYDTYITYDYLNDLWKYDPTSGQWTWVDGSNTSNANGIYGTEGTASSSNIPGARFNAVSWTDASGNVWLFGGSGIDSTWAWKTLNDLWLYK